MSESGPSEGSAQLREAARAVTEARTRLDQTRTIAQQMAAAKRELDRIRETNHFRQSWLAMMREQGHRG